ncbi:MAG: DUF3152 domain-containing protein [Beutenbergiaceae bacterium]
MGIRARLAVVSVSAFAVGVLLGPWVFGPPGAPAPAASDPAPSSAVLSEPEVPVNYATEQPELPTQPPVLTDVQEANLLAGVRGDTVPPTGSGVLRIATGASPAPAGDAPLTTIRVEVETGLDVDDAQLATFVINSLNDPRGWSERGLARFEWTDGEADLRVVLATPGTTDALCAPLETNGLWSCGRDGQAILNAERWFFGAEAFLDGGGDLTGYRQYLVNHEVGHLLGRSHDSCPGPGQPSPVMVQQSISLEGCQPNSWPSP